jgi:hypothetical protein
LLAQRAGMDQTSFGTEMTRGHAALPGQQNKNPAGRKNPQAGLTRPRPFSNLFYVAASRPAQMTTG